jgi:hypothetical protein
LGETVAHILLNTGTFSSADLASSWINVPVRSNLSSCDATIRTEALRLSSAALTGPTRYVRNRLLGVLRPLSHAATSPGSAMVADRARSGWVGRPKLSRRISMASA